MRNTLLAVGIATACLLTPAAAAEAGTGPHVSCPKASVHSTQTGLASFESTSTAGPCTVQLSSWSVPDTYDGKGYDASAKPQVLFDRTVATLTGTAQTVSVKLPASRWCQIDYRAANGKYLYGRIVECHPPIKVTPKPPVITPPKTKPVTHAHTRIVTTARVRSVAPRPAAQLAMTGGVPWPLVELAAAFGITGTALVLASGFRQSGPRHKELSK